MNQFDLLNVYVTLHTMIKEYFFCKSLRNIVKIDRNLIHKVNGNTFSVFLLPLGPYSVYSQLQNQSDPGKT